MNKIITSLTDLKSLLFSPAKFFSERYLQLSSREVSILGFLGVFFGLVAGSAFTLFFVNVLLTDFATNSAPYLDMIKTLGLTEKAYVELLVAQKAYCIMLMVLSPLLAYMAPHLFGGALFAMLWLFIHPEKPFVLQTVLQAAAVSLASAAFYAVPLVGPLLSLVLIAFNVSRALFAHYQIVGFMKYMSIAVALYISCFFSSATLQLLALPLAGFLKT